MQACNHSAGFPISRAKFGECVVGTLGKACSSGQNGIKGGAYGPVHQVNPAVQFWVELGTAELRPSCQSTGRFHGLQVSGGRLLEPIQPGWVLGGNHHSDPVRPRRDLENVKAKGHVPLENRLGQHNPAGLVALGSRHLLGSAIPDGGRKCSLMSSRQ